MTKSIIQFCWYNLIYRNSRLLQPTSGWWSLHLFFSLFKPLLIWIGSLSLSFSPCLQDKTSKGGRFSGITTFFSSLGGGKNKGGKGNEQEMNTKGRPSSEQGLPPINAGQGMVSQSAPSQSGNGNQRRKEKLPTGYTPMQLKHFK